MKKYLLLVSAVMVFCFGIQSCKKSNSNKNPAVINVSGLFSLTGNWSTLGINSKAALQLAAQDINAELKNKNANYQLSVNFYDTKLDPATAQQDFAAAVSSGTRFIIGPQSSAELAAIIPKADSAQAIVISQGSTAGSLAIAGDPVFRFCPPDKVEGAAIAATIFKDNIKGLVTVARNDAGNLGLQTATGSNFTKLGGHVQALAAYSTTITNFTPIIADIKAQLNQQITTYGAAHTAVYLASFDECALLFALANNDAVLSQVKWYGGDGVALSAILLANTAADEFAVKTGFFAPTFGLPVSLQSKWQPVANRIKAITGIEVDAFALAAYDAMWVIANTLDVTQQYKTSATFSQLKTVFAQQSNAYAGVTGSTALDSYGDRDSGSFDYLGIMKADTGYRWTVVGESE
jgi:branched-chain amino acid transport system substrate-binding protein